MVRLDASEILLKHRIDEVYTQYPFCGSRQITARLQQEGVQVNRKAVQRHICEMGREGISPESKLSTCTQKEGRDVYQNRTPHGCKYGKEQEALSPSAIDDSVQ